VCGHQRSWQPVNEVIHRRSQGKTPPLSPRFGVRGSGSEVRGPFGVRGPSSVRGPGPKRKGFAGPVWGSEPRTGPANPKNPEPGTQEPGTGKCTTYRECNSAPADQ